MRTKRRLHLAVALVAGMFLVFLLAGRLAGADTECQDNYPTPRPSPTPSGFVEKTMWREASLYAKFEVRKSAIRYHVCTAWSPPDD